MLWKCCIHYASKFGKLNNGHRTGKRQFSFQSQRRAKRKNWNYCTVALISYASKVMFKIHQVRFQQYMNLELKGVKTGLIKGRGTRDQIANIHWLVENIRKFKKKTCIFALLATQKPLTLWITKNSGIFLKQWEYQPPYLPSVCRSRSNI